MKKLLLFLFIMITGVITINAQSDLVGGGKVKTEKKIKQGIGITCGTMGFTASNHNIKNGVLFGASYIITMPLSNNPESRWLGELDLGFDFCKNDAEASDIFSHDTSITTWDIYMGMRFRKILNPMSTRGKWYFYPGFAFSFAGFPNEERNSRYKNVYLLQEAIGMGLTGECGIGFATRHIGFAIGPFLKYGATFKEDEKNVPLMYGGSLTLSYMF